MDNKEIAGILSEIALLMELAGENPFKIRAYAEGGRIIEAQDLPVAEMIRTGTLGKIKGIGQTLSKQIQELVQEGKIQVHEELKKAFPEGVREMMRVPGLGPRKVKALLENLGIRSIGELEYACHENRLVSLPGFGLKSQEKILQGIVRFRRFQGRFLFGTAYPLALDLVAALKGHPRTIQASLAGSLRRKMEIVGDIDLVVESRYPEEVMAFFTSLPIVDQILSQGTTKSSVHLNSGIQADLRVVGPGQFTSALHHFTGSKAHHTVLRARAKGLGYKLNEYGLFQGEKNIPCQDEGQLYSALGLPFIPPELREDSGEFEAAENQQLPRLVGEQELRGAFHFHTRSSDGTPSLSQWIQAAREKGLTYLGISDHSQSASYAGGLKPEQLKAQQEEIALLNRKQHQVHLFWGIESDILPDGSLDYTPEDLSQFDFIIASVHSRFNMSQEEMTRRIIRAIENPYTTMLGHPTGRLLLARDPYAVDMEPVLRAAARHGVIIELNANPHRLDLDWRLMKNAKQSGLKIAINPDAHHLDGIEDISFGVGIARKGWLSREEVFNCLDVHQVNQFFNHRRKGIHDR